MKRDFNKWLSVFRDSIATWRYYTDFEKVYQNVEKMKDELNILNGLIGKKDIENEFKRIVEKYPDVLKVIPILIAKRESEVKITDSKQNYVFNFKKPNYSIDEYAKFMKNTGLFDLMQNHIIHSLVDYVIVYIYTFVRIGCVFMSDSLSASAVISTQENPISSVIIPRFEITL